jgi:hypothetical protein
MNKTSAILQLSTSVIGWRNANSPTTPSLFRCTLPVRKSNIMKLFSKSILTILFIFFVGQFTISCTNKKQSQSPKVNFIDTFHRMQQTANTEEDYKKAFEKVGLTKHWGLFKSNIKNEILTTPIPSVETDFIIGQSKIGGQPDLPKNIEWFKEDNGKRLSFIAQINFSELSNLDKSQNLPSSGMIYFFYSPPQ